MAKCKALTGSVVKGVTNLSFIDSLSLLPLSVFWAF